MVSFANLAGGLCHALGSPQRTDGGEGGIRTLGRRKATRLFESRALDHYATSPRNGSISA